VVGVAADAKKFELKVAPETFGAGIRDRRLCEFLLKQAVGILF